MLANKLWQPAAPPSGQFQTKLHAATANFADAIAAIVRECVNAFNAPSAGPTPIQKKAASVKVTVTTTRVRRSDTDLAAASGRVVRLLKMHTAGLRIQRINKLFGTTAKELVRPIEKLHAEAKVRKQGEGSS